MAFFYLIACVVIVMAAHFISPCPLECNFQSETKIEPDLRLEECYHASSAKQFLIKICLMKITSIHTHREAVAYM